MNPYFYTEEQEEWLRTNIHRFMNLTEITDEFNSIFQSNKQHFTLGSKIRKLMPGFKWPNDYRRQENNQRSYSIEHDEWIRQNHHKYHSYSELAKDFNATFDTQKSTGAIQQRTTKELKIFLKTTRSNLKDSLVIRYTKEEEKWLLDNYHKYNTYNDLHLGFNEVFGYERDLDSLKDKCIKGLGLKGMENTTTYKKGNLKTQCPIGTIRKTQNVKYIKIKDSLYSYQSGYSEPYWLPLQKKIWIDHYGEVPKGKMVIFLDCNRNNFDINNLYCIDRKISAMMASNGWYNRNAQITLTAIKLCELNCALKKA